MTGEAGASSSTSASPFLSPDAQIKNKAVSLTFTCIDHDGQSHSDDEKYAFCKKTKSLSTVLERWTPKNIRQETMKWYDQLKNEVAEVNKKSITPQQKNAMVADLEYKYALEVHHQNIRLLMNSPIIEVEAEGELDITDEDAIEIIRGGKRTDDGKIVA